MEDPRLQSSLMPDEYAAKMRAARRERAMRGERRIITMLFCDVVDSTAMAARFDPEEWAEIMNEAFEFLITPIYRYEGTVARLLGDAILAFFGAPIAHEDDPQRAILAGLAIIEGIKPFAAGIQQDYGLDFNVRVGINTGPVVVGDVGTDLALEYTAMGDAINLASRMESTAEPGTVQITHDTYELVAPLFNVKNVGKIAVKGKSLPVQAYCVLSRKEKPGHLRGFGEIRTPLIGREEELSTLKALVEKLQNGQGKIVNLTGEAGLGKSRLIEELKTKFNAEIQQEKIAWIEGRGISYDATRPYSVIMQMFRQLCGVSHADSEQAVKRKIRARIRAFRSDARDNMAQALEILLAIEDESRRPNSEGESLKRDLFATFLATWRETVNAAPLVAFFDDLHWADSSSIELLIHAFQLVESTPSLMICSYRPYAQSPAIQLAEASGQQYASYSTTINLQPLTRGEDAQLIGSILAIDDLPPTFYDQVHAKADGNPFFVEEVLRALIDLGADTKENNNLFGDVVQAFGQIEIPTNILSLLVSRIDRLEKETKQVLQLASVIGRSFYRRVLDSIVDLDISLDDHLRSLIEMDLLEQDNTAAEEAYLFRHTLTQEAAYRSILRRQRRRYHLRVAEAIEEHFPQNLDEEAHRLAYHHQEARNFAEALYYYTRAGDLAARLYANNEAVDHYGRALDLALAHGADEQLIYLYKARGRAFEFSGRYEDALADYQALETAALKRSNETMRLEALLAKTTLYSTYTDKFDLPKARETLEESLALAESLQDRRAESKIYWMLMLQSSNAQEDPGQAVAFGEKAVAIARAENLAEELAYALHDLARPYSQIGRMDKAYDAIEESGQLWRELGNKAMLADNLGTLASGFRLQGRLEEALQLAVEALEISRSISNHWGEAYNLNVLGPIYVELGRIDQALDSWNRSLPIAEKANFMGAQAFVRTDMALTYGYLGDTASGMVLTDLALQKILEMGQTDLAYYPQLVQARLHLYDGNIEAAAAIINNPVQDVDQLRNNLITGGLFIEAECLVALKSGKASQMIPTIETALARSEAMKLVVELLRFWRLKARILLNLGEAEAAAAVLTNAQTTAQAIGSRKQLWQILSARQQIEKKKGDFELAGELLQEARAEIAYVASQIADPVLKQSFLETTITALDFE